MRIINDALTNVLTAQWSHEVYNSHLYINILAFLKGKGLDKIALLFEKQHIEEQSHATMILNFLTDVGEVFYPPAIPACPMTFSGMEDLAKAYLEREILTTKSLDEIKQMCIDEGFPVAEEFIRGMISLQQAEYEEATAFYDKAEVIGNDWKFAVIWDAGLG